MICDGLAIIRLSEFSLMLIKLSPLSSHSPTRSSRDRPERDRPPPLPPPCPPEAPPPPSFSSSSDSTSHVSPSLRFQPFRLFIRISAFHPPPSSTSPVINPSSFSCCKSRCLALFTLSLPITPRTNIYPSS